MGGGPPPDDDAATAPTAPATAPATPTAAPATDEPEPPTIEIEPAVEAEAAPVEAEPPAMPADPATAAADLRAAVRGESLAPPPAASASSVAAPGSVTGAGSVTGSAPAARAKPAAGPTRPAKPTKVPPSDDREDDDEREETTKRPKRWPLLLGGLAAVATAITALVLAGRANHRRLYLDCGATHITALRGRSFPPWGRARLGGAAYRPIAIPAATECTRRATRDPIELEGWFLDALIEQATVALASPTGDVDRAEQQLQQALLLARSPDRRDQRKDIDRLLADVTYARGAARVRDAIATLRDAAARFDDAANRRPRHAADAASWAGFARAMADRLGGGPRTESPGTLFTAPDRDRDRPPAPPGVALPVEPPADAGGLPAPDVDAGVPGLPSGGVLM